MRFEQNRLKIDGLEKIRDDLNNQTESQTLIYKQQRVRELELFESIEKTKAEYVQAVKDLHVLKDLMAEKMAKFDHDIKMLNTTLNTSMNDNSRLEKTNRDLLHDLQIIRDQIEALGTEKYNYETELSKTNEKLHTAQSNREKETCLLNDNI